MSCHGSRTMTYWFASGAVLGIAIRYQSCNLGSAMRFPLGCLTCGLTGFLKWHGSWLLSLSLRSFGGSLWFGHGNPGLNGNVKFVLFLPVVWLNLPDIGSMHALKKRFQVVAKRWKKWKPENSSSSVILCGADLRSTRNVPRRSFDQFCKKQNPTGQSCFEWSQSLKGGGKRSWSNSSWQHDPSMEQSESSLAEALTGFLQNWQKRWV